MLLSKEVVGCVGRGCRKIFNHMENHCGSEPARDGGLTVNINIDCAGLIASRLAPTGFNVALAG